jgi:N-acetyl sugar amidotransferase
MDNLLRCTKCVTPETHETIMFNEQGVCNICEQQEFKQTQINWKTRLKELTDIVEKYKGHYDYDCIIPFSGGKDSVWTLYYIVKELKLRPLVVRFDHGFLRPNLNENTKRVTRELGVAVHHFTPNWKVTQKLMLQSFLEKGDFCWHCHTGIFAYPMQVAIRYNIPLIIWGEPSAEYTAYYSFDQPEEVDEKRFNRYVNLGISADDMLIRLESAVDERDLLPFKYPPLKDLRKINYRSICLGSYIPWNVKAQVKIIKKELGWKGDQVENVPSEYDYEKIECYMQGVRDYIKYIKRGYTRPAHLASIDIRNGQLSRKEGVDLVNRYEGKRPPSLDLFLDYIGITEEEFNEIAIQHAVSPYEHDFGKTVHGEKLPDYDKWERKGKMKREDAEVQLKRWRLRSRNKDA